MGRGRSPPRRQRAAFLASLDLAEPRHLGVLLENVPETLFWLEGAALVGVTIVGLNSTRRGAELAADIDAHRLPRRC